MRKNQKGFGLIAVLLLAVILIIGGAGFVIWRHKHAGLQVSYTIPKTWDTNTKPPASTRPQTIKTPCYEATLPGSFKIQKNGGCDIGAARQADGAVLSITSETGDLVSVEAKYKQRMGTKDPIQESDIVTKQNLRVHLMEQTSDATSEYGIWQQVFIIKASGGGWLVQNGAEPITSKSDNVFRAIADTTMLNN